MQLYSLGIWSALTLSSFEIRISLVWIIIQEQYIVLSGKTARGITSSYQYYCVILWCTWRRCEGYFQFRQSWLLCDSFYQYLWIELYDPRSCCSDRFLQGQSRTRDSLVIQYISQALGEQRRGRKAEEVLTSRWWILRFTWKPLRWKTLHIG